MWKIGRYLAETANDKIIVHIFWTPWKTLSAIHTQSSVYHAPSVQFRRAKLTTHFDSRRAVAKFSKYRVYRTKFQLPSNAVQNTWKKDSVAETSSIRPEVSTELRLVPSTDRQTDRQTDTEPQLVVLSQHGVSAGRTLLWTTTRNAQKGSKCIMKYTQYKNVQSFITSSHR